MVVTNAPTMVAAMWSVTAIAFVFFVLRLVTKRKYGKMITLDDWILVLSWCLLAIYTSLVQAATKYGLGNRITDIDEEDLPYATKYLTIGEFFAVLALQISKTSFAVTLLRLVTRTWEKMSLWTIIISLNLVMGIDAIIIFASCNPVEKIWRAELPGRCWNPKDVVNVSIFAGVYSGLMDLLLAAFPMVIIRQLKVEKKEKLGVGIAMSLGVFAGIATFIKSSYIPQLGRWKDVMYSSYIILIWAAAEAAITIVATCIPSLRLILVRSRKHPGGHEIRDEEVNVNRTVRESEAAWTASITSNRQIPIPVSGRATLVPGTGVMRQD